MQATKRPFDKLRAGAPVGTAIALIAIISAAGCRTLDARRPLPAHPEGRHTLACHTIVEAGRVPDPLQRAETLLGLARRTDLREHEQILLANALCIEADTTGDPAALVTLSHNPTLTTATRQHILEQLVCVPDEYDQARIVQALGP